tara:strand:+ start:302 stop:1039 length:738 start_codon:yes stop_codon:yes gene_type:complete
MGIQYERTMKINYGDMMDDMTFRRLVGAMAEKQLYVCGKYDNYADNKYGFQPHDDNKTQYIISSLHDGYIMTVDYRSDADAIITGFESIIEGIVMETANLESVKMRWAEPEGSAVVVFGEGINGISNNLDCWGENELIYEVNGEEVSMSMRIINDYEGLRLKFLVVWKTNKIQRKDVIEEAMVDLVMNDMGKIQAIVESKLKLKKFGYDIENVSIDCHFDAKTESRSECTPDIIKQVRDARKGLE